MTDTPKITIYGWSTKHVVGSGAGAVALSGVRSRSHFSPGFPAGRFTA